MRFDQLRIVNVRCFDDSGDVDLSPTCNIFVGKNNVGKSTVLKALLGFQAMPFGDPDIRSRSQRSFVSALISDIKPNDHMMIGATPRSAAVQAIKRIAGGGPYPNHPPEYKDQFVVSQGNSLFGSNRPAHSIVPFLAKRKAQQFDQNVTLAAQTQLTGTLANLYSRIDLVATAGHPRHEEFLSALKEIVGLPITTRASQNGKEAGFYLDEYSFVSLDRMGDGVAEMVALIVELCLERNKIFILEEPETNLHPSGLKALLEMVRRASTQNQFIVATHSNIVVRELAADERSRVFRVFREDENPRSPSKIELVPRNPTAHVTLLRELGYEFSDVGLYEAWLFLEEASAEQIVNEILVPFFVPNLKGRLRTYSASGVSNVEPGVAEFQRLVVFIHLQPAYEGKLWIRVDGGEQGDAVVSSLRNKFGYLTEQTCRTFSAGQFEKFYPENFKEHVASALAIGNKRERQKAKTKLMQDMIEWSLQNPDQAKNEWAVSAEEVIELLQAINDTINVGS